MAVARHSDNIEVQDEDQDDTNYENETTVTTRRTNVEMSEEGHYERLDLQKKDDAVYEDLRTKTRKHKGLPKKIRQSGSDEAKNNLDRVAAVCLGLLCLLLSVVIIALVIHFTELIKKKDKLTEDPSQLICQKRILCELSGWKTFGRGCYYISTEKKTWGESRRYCIGNQSDLMVINSKEKQDFVISFNKFVWLGLKEEKRGNWIWVDETPLTTPQYWGKNEPNYSGRCVALVADGSIKPTGWYDRECNMEYHWICERLL